MSSASCPHLVVVRRLSACPTTLLYVHCVDVTYISFRPRSVYLPCRARLQLLSSTSTSTFTVARDCSCYHPCPRRPSLSRETAADSVDVDLHCRTRPPLIPSTSRFVSRACGNPHPSFSSRCLFVVCCCVCYVAFPFSRTIDHVVIMLHLGAFAISELQHPFSPLSLSQRAGGLLPSPTRFCSTHTHFLFVHTHTLLFCSHTDFGFDILSYFAYIITCTKFLCDL